MKFSGELKFPEIDHPGVPVRLDIEDALLEILIDGETVGRWSLFDVHARRLVASAFEIDLDGTEVTFVADDPIDFAYRGVEHMAETWATLKAKRMAARTLAVRKSRRDTIPSRIDEMRTAMEANLHAQSAPRQIAGEGSMPDLSRTGDAGSDLSADVSPGDWDVRDQGVEIPMVGSEPDSGLDVAADLSEQVRLIEEERSRLAAERVELEEERRLAEQQEANRVEAFRLEMQRLEAERDELRRLATDLAERTGSEFEEALDASGSDEAPVIRPEPELTVEEESALDHLAPEPPDESEPISEIEVEPSLDDQQPEPEPETIDEPVVEPEPEPVASEEEPIVEPEPAAGVLDLKELEEGETLTPGRPAPAPRPLSPEPALAGASKDKGLRRAVRAAFRSGPKHHEHQFIEAPGGMGITRYVCEECGYVSISA